LKKRSWIEPICFYFFIGLVFIDAFLTFSHCLETLELLLIFEQLA
jgi:hypothetical protein